MHIGNMVTLEVDLFGSSDEHPDKQLRLGKGLSTRETVIIIIGSYIKSHEIMD